MDCDASFQCKKKLQVGIKNLQAEITDSLRHLPIDVNDIGTINPRNIRKQLRVTSYNQWSALPGKSKGITFYSHWKKGRFGVRRQIVNWSADAGHRCITYEAEKLPSKYGVHSEEYVPIRTLTPVVAGIELFGNTYCRDMGRGLRRLVTYLLTLTSTVNMVTEHLICVVECYRTQPTITNTLRTTCRRKTQFERGYGSTQTVQTAICCYDVQVIPYTFSSSD
ncbi:hypothetical protein ANN_11750 [Periplaneta americana]|uniref:Uncharacterized protein n=1 Tax=Periplaneta americana TaxID=6978 RepID=A0ABQ8T7P6_PERAM|nr:hypothetical protein ANN_11750 [Periplaneta americana]